MKLWGLLGVPAIVACAMPREPVVLPETGATDVVLDEHLPSPLRISSVLAVLDGELIYRKKGPVPPRTLVFRGRLPEGDHTLQLRVEIDVPCGLLTEPHETLIVKGVRTFEVGPGGGLVYIDTFVRQPWLDPAAGVRMPMSLHGMREGRWIYGHTDEAKQKCGGLSRGDRARCVVEQLVEQSRHQRDVVALLCHSEKLVEINAAIASSPENEARIEELEREAEHCVGQQVAFFGSEQVTWEPGRCAGYADRVP